jgi:tRNA/tmRNA/rRNA uracil-C5-methylase (TrmA/RlmC/RlmD family)
VGIVQNVNSRRGNAIFGREDITLWGRPYIEESLGDLIFKEWMVCVVYELE